MLGKKDVRYENIDTVIAGKTAIKGDINSEGSIRIDGTVDGSLNVKGDLVIGNQGKVKGNIFVTNILIAGKVEGNVIASDRLEITPTGTINGDVKANVLIVEEGGRLLGNCDMAAETSNTKK
ncbi:MAG: bactofilin family protein [Chitinophagales bacterium]